MRDHTRRAAARLHVVPIVLLALVLRLAIVFATARAHPAAWFFSQATELAQLAEHLRTGLGLSSPFGGNTGPSAFLAPGYPTLVAAVFALFGAFSHASFVGLMALQACFGAATVWALMRLALRAFGAPAANLAGVIWAVAPPALFLPTLFWETSLSILLATCLLAWTLRTVESTGWAAWLWLGALSGGALMVNPSLLSLVLSCMGWATYRSAAARRGLLRAAAGIAMVAVLSLPWTLRNGAELHAFVPLRDNLGYELWQGNRPGGDGFFEASLHPNVNAAELQELQTMGEVSYMKHKGQLATGFIKSHPAHFLALTARRAFYFWTGVNRNPSGLVILYISLTTLGGVTGLLRLARNNAGLASYFLLPMLLFPVAYYITHPDFRFRLVLDPMLVALTASLFSGRSGAEPNLGHAVAVRPH
jgi:hypothetical protein